MKQIKSFYPVIYETLYDKNIKKFKLSYKNTLAYLLLYYYLSSTHILNPFSETHIIINVSRRKILVDVGLISDTVREGELPN